MRFATFSDLPLLVALMQDFYAEAGYALDHSHATAAFATLLGEERFGRIWLVTAEHQVVGYLVLTFGYSMEYGGRKAMLDDFFLQAPFRGKGLGRAALAAMKTFCAHHGIRAVSVEVGVENALAQAVYRHAGFAPAANREVLTLELAAPTHLVEEPS